MYPRNGIGQIDAVRGLFRLGRNRFRYKKTGAIIELDGGCIFKTDIGVQKLFRLRRGKKTTARYREGFLPRENITN